MPRRVPALFPILAVLVVAGLIFGPTSWAAACVAAAKAPMDSCCAAHGNDSQHGSSGCCGVAPANPDCGFPAGPDRTAGNIPAQAPAAVLVELIAFEPLQPPVRDAAPAAALFAVAEHAPPVLSRGCILLI